MHLLAFFMHFSYSEPTQTSKMKLLAKIVNGFRTVFAKRSILCVWLGFECASTQSIFKKGEKISFAMPQKI